MNKVRLGDVATYINGYAFKPADRSSVGLPIIRIQDLTGNAYDLGFYDGEYPERIEINNGDVLISWSASLGVYVWNKGKALLNQHIFKVVFDKIEIDKQFFVYAVEHSLQKMVKQTHGATMKHIIKKDFDNTLIPYPSLEQQKSIAKLLDKTCDLIGKMKLQASSLDELIKSRFVEMFLDTAYPWIELIDLIIEGAGLSYGIVQPGDDGTGEMGVLRPVDIIDGVISMNSIKYIDRRIADGNQKTELYGNELLITVRGTTGITALTDKRFSGMNVTRGIAVIRYNENIVNPLYLNSFFKTEKSQRYIQENTRGATLKQINLSDLRKQQILVPPLELQNQFADFVTKVEKQKATVQQSIDKLETLKKSLMQKYFG